MNILALDTSFGACSAAVLKDGAMFSDYEEMARGHAEALMPMVARVMDHAALAYADIDVVAAATGPGSFTGVRIAIAAAHGFAIACEARASGASSLSIMARRLLGEGAWTPAHGPLAICIDARRDEFYFALFGGSPDRTIPVLLPLAVAAAMIPAGATLAGSGAVRVGEACGRSDLTVIAPGLQPNAAALAELVAAGEAEDGPLRPLYLRPPDAKPSSAPSLRSP